MNKFSQTPATKDHRNASLRLTGCVGMVLVALLLPVEGCASGKPDVWQSGNPVPHPKSYVCHHTASALNIDGRFDETAWSEAAWTDEFTDIEGDLRPAPRYRTKAKMLWTDDYFVIGAVLSEPHIWGTLVKRDTVIFYDNDFEVFIDPNGDNHEYYEFEMNALNTVWDLFLPRPYRDKGSAVDSWNINGLKTAVSIHGTLNDSRDIDSSWTVEIAMPWSALGEFAHKQVPPAEGDHWRVNFSRVEWTTTVEAGKYVKVKGLAEDNWVWSPQWAIDMHRPELWGYVHFTRKPAGSVTVVPDPSWDAHVELLRVYHAQRAFFEKHERWAGTLTELGIDHIAPPSGITAPIIQLTGDGFVCSLQDERVGRQIREWHIRQDSRIWGE